MKYKDIQELTDEELAKKVEEGRAELFNLRFQMATSQLDNTARVKNVKKDIARLLTEQRARQMISHEEVYLQAQKEADDLMKNAQAKIKELRQVTNDYVDDSMKRTEEAIAQALSEIRESRSKFRALVNPQQAKPSPIIEDV